MAFPPRHSNFTLKSLVSTYFTKVALESLKGVEPLFPTQKSKRSWPLNYRDKIIYKLTRICLWGRVFYNFLSCVQEVVCSFTLEFIYDFNHIKTYWIITILSRLTANMSLNMFLYDSSLHFLSQDYGLLSLSNKSCFVLSQRGYHIL